MQMENVTLSEILYGMMQKQKEIPQWEIKKLH